MLDTLQAVLDTYLDMNLVVGTSQEHARAADWDRQLRNRSFVGLPGVAYYTGRRYLILLNSFLPADRQAAGSCLMSGRPYSNGGHVHHVQNLSQGQLSSTLTAASCQWSDTSRFF